MTYEPRFQYTAGMVRRLMTISAARALVDVLPVPPDAAFMMKYEAQKRSTHFSTSIEGNELSLDQIREGVAFADRTGSRQQQEVRNYWRALEWVERRIDGGTIDEEFIRRLHAIIDVRGRGRRVEESGYRTEECPVVDKATGALDYAPPRPDDVPELMAGLVAWLRSANAAELPAPVRAAILAHRFVSIHPFGDGNGRTARALATAELWFSGYWMRGFLSVEEYYYRDLARYYQSLQMDLPIDFYDGRHDPDLTPWLEYFLEVMERASIEVRDTALRLWDRSDHPPAPWEELNRRQQQLLARLVIAHPESADVPTFSIPDLQAWFGVSRSTAGKWIHSWHDDGFLEPASGDVRITAWRPSEQFQAVVASVRKAVNCTE
ncbi:MAG: Fic family protein [Armatimonadota bacterium]